MMSAVIRLLAHNIKVLESYTHSTKVLCSPKHTKSPPEGGICVYAPVIGFEPMTNSLTASCATTAPHRNWRSLYLFSQRFQPLIYGLPMHTPSPTAGTAHSLFHLVHHHDYSALSCLILLGGSDPANPLVSSEWRNIFPK